MPSPLPRAGAVRRFLLPFAVLNIFLGLASALRAERVTRDIPFATVDGITLKLDLYLPDRPPAGLIVWVHGGAWRAGSRTGIDLNGITAQGWALASVDYRLSTQARFPAQIHDIKAAIRFLRAKASELGFPAQPFIVSGSSAGGHLAELVGVTNGVAELEGTVGDHRDVSSDVQATVVLYGASNLTTILAQSTPHGIAMREPALELLLGALPDKAPALAKLASPVFHVDRSDPPMLVEHGDQDPQMPVNQALEIVGACEKAGVPVELKIMHGSGHGGPAFKDAENLRFIDDFLRRHVLRKN
ncbi:MAG TPA: alpha/beta hydrolase [Opitutaceae bacterium]|nr:alpha/beta hydrolase [Opitutaceae bacterium]